ncbi:MAG: helix-turn-helix transcriptional regulator [Bacteroidetes bacterium]|nr:helix-turn-helix transcriptional regulator [Bacteroidota bacterium]
MAKSKTTLFPKTDIDLAEIAKSLAHPARVQILKILLNKSPQNCASIVEQLPLAQATVSQHLAELKHSGLLIDKKSSNMILYSVNNERIASAGNQFIELFLGHSKNSKQQKLL